MWLLPMFVCLFFFDEVFRSFYRATQVGVDEMVLVCSHVMVRVSDRHISLMQATKPRGQLEHCLFDLDF